MRNSGRIYYTNGTQEHFVKIASSKLGVDACHIEDYIKQVWSFIPWCSIHKIVYDTEE